MLLCKVTYKRCKQHNIIIHRLGAQLFIWRVQQKEVEGIQEPHGTGTHQQGRVDDLRIGMVQEENETRQAALILDDGPPVKGICGEVPQLVNHGQGIRLPAHGAPRTPTPRAVGMAHRLSAVATDILLVANISTLQ